MKKLQFTSFFLLIMLLFNTASFSQGVQPLGLGTEADPYQIETLDNLLWISSHSTSWDSYFIQTINIDASATSTWNGGEGFIPIGSFTGEYNGQGHTISGLYINRPGVTGQGMFSFTQSGLIENLGLTNVNITGANNTAALSVRNSFSTFINCFSTGTVNGESSIGGLIWESFVGTITNCHSNVNVKVGENGYDSYLIGGLVGYSVGSNINNCFYSGSLDFEDTEGYKIGGLIGYSNYDTINNCYNSGRVGEIANGFVWDIGGLIGKSEHSTINNCHNCGNIGDYWNDMCVIGGLIGNSNYDNISNCYNTGNVIIQLYAVGGLVGNCDSTIISNCYNTGSVEGMYGDDDMGGLVGGCIYYSEIINCYNSGSVNNQYLHYGGGLVGISDPTVVITNSFWDIETSGQVTSNGGTGKTTAEMQDLMTFMGPGWDFIDESLNGAEDIWGINSSENNGYPFLAWQGYTHVNPYDSPLGDGTETFPYQIDNLYHLFWLSSEQTVWDKHFIQTADIDASTTATWDDGEGFSPIGNSVTNFTGSYNGQQYKIDSLFINRPGTSFQGLFGYAFGASLENLELTNLEITGYNYTGGLVGIAADNSIINNCSVSGYVEGAYCAGGLVGLNQNSSVVSNCSTSGFVDGGDDTGGLVGRNFSSTVETSYSSCDVNGYWETGGLVGMNTTSGNILNCYSTGPVWGNANNGGLLGRNTINSIVINCYSIGHVSGNSVNGGLVADNISSSQVNNSFWNTQTSGQTTSAGGTGKTTTQMKDLVTYIPAEWDFIGETYNGTYDYWGINSANNGGYPFLQWQDYTHYQPVGFPVGNGAETTPFEIETLDNLQWLSEHQAAWDLHFIQIADIDASETSGWNGGAGFLPIGESTPFTGNYDGQGHTISGLYIYRSITSEIGLFSEIDGGDISNLGVVNVQISTSVGTEYGGLVGHCTNGNISNCYTTGSVANGYIRFGGLVGYCSNTTINNCYSAASADGERLIGGLVGECHNTTINNCYFTGWAVGQEYIGGLVGLCLNSTINNCYSSGSVLGGLDYTGGLAGGIQSSNITNSFWDIETSLQTTSPGGTGKTTAEMKNVATYTDLTTIGLDFPWDFVGDPNDDMGTEDIWDIDPANNNGYPHFYEHLNEVALTVYLEGPFNGTNMNIHLTGQPEPVEGFPLSQPYNTSPWNYTGTESVVSIPPNVVDWVLIELRDAADATSAGSGTIIDSQAGFILKNGDIVSVDSTSTLAFAANVSENLFVVIHHRNHLKMMSANALTQSVGAYTYDFTTAISQAYQSGQKMVNGKAVMYGGDVNADGSIDQNDDDIWATKVGSNGYLNSDITMDGQADNKDKNDVWILNNDTNSQVPD